MRHATRGLAAAVVLAAAVGFTGCHLSSNVQRCDDQISRQEEAIAGMGGWLRCDPSYDADEQANCPPSYRCSSVMEWDTKDPRTGARAPTAWAWERNLDGYWLQVNAWQLVAETYAWKAGQIPPYYLDVQRDAVPPSVEQQAFAWAVQQAG